MIYRPDRWFNFDELEAEMTRLNIVWFAARDCARSDFILDETPDMFTPVGAQPVPDDLRKTDSFPIIQSVSPTVSIPYASRPKDKIESFWRDAQSL